MMGSWNLVFNTFEPENEPLREALCTLGNGYFATRGAWAQSDAGDVHYPGTYLACLYNRLKTEIKGRTIENEDLVNIPNWLPLRVRILKGKWFEISKSEILDFYQELDMKSGILLRNLSFRDVHGHETRLKERRLVHMKYPHLAGIELCIKPLNWTGMIEIVSAIDGSVTNSGVARYRSLNGKHLKTEETGDAGERGIFLKTRTVQSDISIALAADHSLYLDNSPLDTKGELLLDENIVARTFVADVPSGSEFRIEKTLALYNSRDKAISECGLQAKKAVSRAPSFDKLVTEHDLAWKKLWQRFEMSFVLKNAQKNDDESLILNMNIFHLLQTISPNSIDLDTGVPSRGWHGEAYRGHIFWDELFIFPFLNMRIPEITRSLLMYRYRRLDEARHAAVKEGFKGAMYPWQSGSDGREESQKLHLNPKSGRWIPDNSRLQRHVNAAIAYNVCKYYEVTGDMEFLSSYGAEMVIEIARFWADISTYNDKTGRYEILGVMGPDEYHEAYPGAEKPGLDNNAYTNVMAVWVLKEALKILQIIPEGRDHELRGKIKLKQEELEKWKDIGKKMTIAFHDGSIISQFEGYENLKEFQWDEYKKKYVDIQRLDRILEAEGDSTNNYRASKQADVLMLFYLFSAEELESLFEGLGYSLTPDMIPENIEYYSKRTSHGSSLSRLVHSWVLVRSQREKSWTLFKEALKSDYSDIQGGTTPEGIHLGAMAGSVNIIQEAYTGLETRENVLWFNCCLPDELEKIMMNIHYRGHDLEIEVACDRLTVKSLSSVGEHVRVGINEMIYKIGGKETITFDT
ncbi:MAG: glycoside hydrolase family 65 protein [Deltaproteobacteria bacterium]|nr:glycoside hydrolase family 65 protein [Deltaproteobacteria bacterium]